MADKPIKLPDVTRRGFVKGAAAAAAAAGMFGTSTWLEHEAAHATEGSPNEEIRYCWHKGHCAGYCSPSCS